MTRDAAARAGGGPDPVRRDGSGFRLRGLGMTRIETFTDAAFAFALTLLVISSDPVGTLAELDAALLRVPAFLLSAVILMMFWWGHHQWSRRYGLEDGTTLVLSFLLVFTVLVYVYPLRFMFGAMMAWVGWMTGLPLGADAGVGRPEEVNRLFAVYGVGFATMAGTLLLLHLHAWRRRGLLELDAVERHETRAWAGVWGIMVAAGVASVGVALAAPPSMAGTPGWVYALLGVAMPLYGRMVERRRPAAEPGAACDDAAPGAPLSHA